MTNCSSEGESVKEFCGAAETGQSTTASGKCHPQIATLDVWLLQSTVFERWSSISDRHVGEERIAVRSNSTFLYGSRSELVSALTLVVHEVICFNGKLTEIGSVTNGRSFTKSPDPASQTEFCANPTRNISGQITQRDDWQSSFSGVREEAMGWTMILKDDFGVIAWALRAGNYLSFLLLLSLFSSPVQSDIVFPKDHHFSWKAGQQQCGVNLLCEQVPRAVAKLGGSGPNGELESFKPDLHQCLGEQNAAL
ncbi:hypothetical protein JOB18_015025 [Solea senegalensis]|uniref:Uncharacterized protein n=1 Tax=Solea senegalensis TaxID=28829 RepID=A0AAV6RAA0_SOLSE|nr:hypothetical protein JOB18_015025 [Solea senegalensis]